MALINLKPIENYIKCAFHLSFNGNCEMAMKFYQNCLKGELRIQYVEENFGNLNPIVLQAILKCGETTIIATDLMDDEKRISGNNMSIHLTCNSILEFENLKSKLSRNSANEVLIDSKLNGDSIALITDCFDNNWILNLYTEALI